MYDFTTNNFISAIRITTFGTTRKYVKVPAEGIVLQLLKKIPCHMQGPKNICCVHNWSLL